MGGEWAFDYPEDPKERDRALFRLVLTDGSGSFGLRFGYL